ncbi:MAG: uracil-DNA glycosylase [Spirochaetales bacterium]|nr:uracil-DNA glycosylase [Spirochaetales bacterium]
MTRGDAYTRLHDILTRAEVLLTSAAEATRSDDEPEATDHDTPRHARIAPSDERSVEGEVSRSGEPASPTTDRLEKYADLSADERSARLAALAETIRACRLCPLALGRTNAVPGIGVVDPLVMVVGEGPGFQEDRQGVPFVGKAGQYLDKWLASIGLSRETNAFIANIVKCRPPNNRDPKPEESDACTPYLDEQLALVRPRLIVTVGRISTRLLTGSSEGITRIHGSFFRHRGLPLIPTFHPAAVLRNPDWRRPVWEDLKRVRNWLVDNAGHRAPEHPGG